MEELTEAQQMVLDVIDDQLKEIEKQLKPMEPLIRERDRLNQTRRVLLSERGTTGGAGNRNAKITMEEIVATLSKKKKSGLTAAEIATRLSVDPTVVRSHLNRHKGVRYEQRDNNKWFLVEAD